MMPAKRGLIVEVTENDIIGGGANPIAHAVKTPRSCFHFSGPRSSRAWHHGPRHHARLPPLGNRAAALRRDRGHLARGGQEGSKLPGVGVAAVRGARDRRAGRGSEGAAPHRLLLSSWELAREYGFTDYDGRRPDWGRHKIDFSVLPPEWIDCSARAPTWKSSG
jgi:hypothetical protein